jgi:O-antigen ligase
MLKVKHQFNYNEIITILLFLYLGTVYFSVAISNILLSWAVSIFVIGLIMRKIKLNFKTHNWHLYAFIIIPFVLTTLSVLLSDNSFKGLKYLWLRLPILITPFIIIFLEVKKESIIRGLKIFLGLTVLASLITIYNAIRYLDEGILFVPDFTFFITIIQHPYFGVFALITLVSIIEFKLIKIKPLKISVYILLILAIALATSRLVYLLFFLVMVFYLVKKFSKKKAMFFAMLLSVFALTFIFSNKSILAKFQTSTQYENSPRLKLWNNAYKVITSSENRLFGIGIGDYYQNKKDPYFFKESENGTYGYDPHSQILEIFVTNGVFGLLTLLITIVFGIINIKKQSRFAIIVFGMILMFSLTESILSRQYGVQLYSIFMPLIFNKNLKNRK